MCTKGQVGPKENWTPLETFKYKWPQPHLDTHHHTYSLYWFVQIVGICVLLEEFVRYYRNLHAITGVCVLLQEFTCGYKILHMIAGIFYYNNSCLVIGIRVWSQEFADIGIHMWLQEFAQDCKNFILKEFVYDCRNFLL